MINFIKKNKKILFTIALVLCFFTFSNVMAETSPNFYNVDTISCGNVKNIPIGLPKYIRGVINLIKILVPLILIVLGMIDFTKAFMAGDEKSMKEKSNKFIKRLIAAVIIFFVIALTQYVFKLTGKDSKTFMNCIACFTSSSDACGGISISEGDCEKGTFYNMDTSKCEKCPAGSYSLGGTTTSCTLCPKFTYSADEGSAYCITCYTFKSLNDEETGKTYCPKSTIDKGSTTQAIAGFYINYYGTGHTDIAVPCPEGTYSDVVGATTCKKCGAGTYASGKANTTCISCSIGYASSEEAAECSLCSEGYTSSRDKSTCEACPNGTFSYSGSPELGCQSCNNTSCDIGGSGTCPQCKKSR